MLGSRVKCVLVPGLVLGLGAQPALGQSEDPPSTPDPASARTAPQRPVQASDAASDKRTVTVVSPADHPTLPLLRAELEALQLSIREIGPDEPPVGSDFRVVLGEGHIEVWVLDPQTRRFILREVFTQADASPVESFTAVLHAVELLRAQLNAPAPPPKPPGPATEPSPEPPERWSGWMLSAAGQLVYSSGGTTVGAGAEVDVVRYWSKIGVRGFATATLLPNRQAAQEGVAEARPRFAGVQGVWISSGDESPLVANLGAGVALVSTHLSASGENGYRADDDHLLTVSPIVDLRVGAPLGEAVALVAVGAVLIPLRSDRMMFGDREVARHGAVFITGGLGVQFTLP